MHGDGKDNDSAWNENSNIEARCGGVVKACSEWLTTHVAFQVEEAYLRANPEALRDSKLCLGLEESISHDEPTTWTSRSDSLPLERRSSDDGNAILGQGIIKQPPIRKLHSVDGSTHVVASSVADVNIVASDDLDQNNLENPSAYCNISNRSITLSQFSCHQDQISFNAQAASTSKSRLGSITTADDISTSESLRGVDLSHNIFLSDAAGSSKGRIISTPLSGPGFSLSPSKLGYLGSVQHGLYLVLHADDIHTMTDITSALRNLYSSSIIPSLGSMYQTSHHYLLDPVLSKIARLLKASGDVILYGTHELMAELGPVLSQCWKDQDHSACVRFGALILDKAKILTRAGFVVSVKTRLELFNEVRAKTIINLLSLLSESCDPFCLQVSLGLSGQYPYTFHSNELAQIAGCLTHMLLGDLKLPRMITIPWHSLLLLLLSNPVFKRELANSYCEVYSTVSNQYAKGIGLQEMSCFVLSVQFLNRASFVQNLVRDRDLISVICRCLLEMLSLALNKKNGDNENLAYTDEFDAHYLFGDHSLNPWTLPPTAAATDWAMGRRSASDRICSSQDAMDASRLNHTPHRLDPTHPVLSSKRYLPCISDFKYVLNVRGMARIFASLPVNRSKPIRLRRKCIPSLDAFLETLTLAQHMDEQKWRKLEEGHVENEMRSWIFAFNASISLGSLSERLLNWNGMFAYLNNTFSDVKILSNNINQILSSHYIDDDPVPMGSGNMNGDSVKYLSAVELTHYVLTYFVFDWMKTEIVNFPSANLKLGLSIHDSSSLYLPFSSVAISHGAPTVFRALPVAQTHPWSFHHPLFRFLGFCFIELSRRPYNQAFKSLLVKMRDAMGLFKSVDLYRGLMEFTVLLLSRVAQIKAGLYRRNGSNMLDQASTFSFVYILILFSII